MTNQPDHGKRKWLRFWSKEAEVVQSQATHVCPHNPDQDQRTCEVCQTERSARRKYRWKIISGLFLPFALSSLDATIIASALPWIAADFNKISQMNWIISVFNLTAAAFIPFWGQMADLFGRHWSIQACMLFIIIGSAFSTGAPSSAFPLLLFGRALQGTGSAGMDIIIRAIVADRVSLKEDAKNWSIFSFVGGVSYAVGPVIGGYLTNANWRWCFGINLPIGVAGMLVVFFLRKELLGPQPIPGLDEPTQVSRLRTIQRRCQTIDSGGQTLSVFGFGLLILAFTWAGATYGWDSPAVLVPLIAGALLVIGFLLWERSMSQGGALEKRLPLQQAMIPWKVITTRDIGLLFFMSFASGMSLFSVLYFCNLYFTMVKQFDSGEAGRQLLFYIPGLGTGVWMAAFMCTTYPRQTWHPLFLGSVIEAIGIAFLAWALWIEKDGLVYGMMALAGVGTGIRFMPVSLHAMAYFPRRKAAIISLMELSTPFGGTIGLTIMTTVFNNVARIGHSLSGDFSEVMPKASNGMQDIAKDAKRGIVVAFISIFPFMVVCSLAAGVLGNVYISEHSEGDEDNAIYRGMFLWALVRGEKPRESVEREENEC